MAMCVYHLQSTHFNFRLWNPVCIHTTLHWSTEQHHSSSSLLINILNLFRFQFPNYRFYGGFFFHWMCDENFMESMTNASLHVANVARLASPVSINIAAAHLNMLTVTGTAPWSHMYRWCFHLPREVLYYFFDPWRLSLTQRSFRSDNSLAIGIENCITIANECKEKKIVQYSCAECSQRTESDSGSNSYTIVYTLDDGCDDHFFPT